MPRFLFPGFQFGAPASSVSTVAPVSLDPWTKLALFAEVWGYSRNTVFMPRFERIFPLPPVLVPTQPQFASNVNFVYEVVSEFPWIIESDNQVRLNSTISVP